MTKTRFLVPPLGEAVTETTIARWHKRPGEPFVEGESLLEVETDKMTVDVPAPASGVLVELVAKESDTLPIGGVLAILELTADATPSPAERGSTDVTPAPAQPAPAPLPRVGLLERRTPPRPRPADVKHVVVVGGGTTGFTIATRIAQLGHEVDLIERADWLGGDDLDGGYVARRTLLASGVRWRDAATASSVGPPRPAEDAWSAIVSRARKEERTMRSAHESLRSARKIRRHRGTGRVRPFLVDQRPVVDVLNDAAVADETLEPDHVVVATGTEPSIPAGVEIDGERVLAPRDVLALREVPLRLAILASDVTGLEWAMAFSELGAAITLIDVRLHLFPALDEDVERGIRRWIERRGVRVDLVRKPVGVQVTPDRVTTRVAGPGGETDEIESDRVLCAMARCPAPFRHVPDDPRVHVVRPRVSSAASPSRANQDAVELAERIARVPATRLPRPEPELVQLGRVEVAWVGATESELGRRGIPYRVGKAPFVANAATRAAGTVDGYVKLVVHATSDRVLGAQIWGPSAGALIGEVALAISLGALGDEMARTPRPPGALSEVLSEAARSAAGWPLMLLK